MGTSDSPLPISVVVSTYSRPDACRAAVESVLAQRPMPLEVLVCDDGSPAAVADEVRAWCVSQPAVEFIGLMPNRGTPAPARNAGLRRARGEWIAFLDDDDLWLPGKLATQWKHAKSGKWDVIAGDGVRTNRTAFYTDAMRPPHEPSHADVLTANPVILSTALARRSVLVAAGGFPEQRRLAGIEDYGLWLAAADRGARFLVLGEPLVQYEDSATERLSAAAVRVQISLAGMVTKRFLRAPWRAPRARAAVRESGKAARFVVGGVLGRGR